MILNWAGGGGGDRRFPISKGLSQIWGADEIFMFIKRDQRMIKLWGTAVENLENIKHRAPVLNLTWALELRPEPYKPVFYYISEVTRSASPPWQPGLQKYSVTHCDIHLEKSPCGNLHQLLQKGFRNLLSFKRNWFHFSNFNFSVFFFIYYILPLRDLSWVDLKVRGGEESSQLL